MGIGWMATSLIVLITEGFFFCLVLSLLVGEAVVAVGGALKSVERVVYWC